MPGSHLPGREPGRIRVVSADRCALYVELRSGSIATVSRGEPFDFNVGEIILIDTNSASVETAPADLWPSNSLVGVVKLRSSDRVVVESSGRLFLLPDSGDSSCEQGNTVEFDEYRGVKRILSQDPIRLLELPAIDDSVIGRFRTYAKDIGPTSFDEFGGSPELIERAREFVELPLIQHDKLAAIGARAVKGVLFTGPPGTGKTMLARIIAGRADATFYEIGGPEIFDKYVGQSEELVRKIFEDAARQERAIVFFDEIDSIATQRAEESHDVSRRVVAQLLTAIDGFNPEQNVIVIATTNRPQDIDVALLRRGRFDWRIEFPSPSLADREHILRVSSKDLMTTGSLAHGYVAAQTDGWSGAELTAIWTEAAILAVKDGRSTIRGEDYLGGLRRVASYHKNLHDHLDEDR